MYPNLLSRFRLVSPGEGLCINTLLGFKEHESSDKETKG